MNSEINSCEIDSNVEHQIIYSEFDEYLQVESVRETEDDIFRETEDSNYRII